MQTNWFRVTDFLIDNAGAFGVSAGAIELGRASYTPLIIPGRSVGATLFAEK